MERLFSLLALCLFVACTQEVPIVDETAVDEQYTFDCNPNPPTGWPRIKYTDCLAASQVLDMAFPSVKGKPPPEWYYLTVAWP